MENQKRTLIRHFRPTPPISAHFPLSTLFPPNSSYFPSFHPIPLFSFFFLFSLFPPLDAPAMCSLRCAHTPTPRCYVLTTLRTYAYAAVLCAHCVARIRTASSAISLTLNTLRSPLDAPAMCSLRCAHTPTPRCYVLTTLRAYAPPAPLFR